MGQVDYAALAKQFGGAAAVAQAPPPDPHQPRMSAAAPGTALPGSADPDEVTLGELMENPRDAIARIGANLKRDVSDPKTWLAIGASYFAPRVFSSAAPAIARAAAAMPKPSGGMLSRVAGALEPGDIGIVSPRLGRAVDLAQRVRGAVRPQATAAEPVATAPAAAAAAPPPAPVPRPPAPREPAAASPSPAKFRLSAPEQKEYIRLIKAGKSRQDIFDLIEAQRAFAKRMNLPSGETVRGSISDRNASGRWPE